MKFEQAFDVLLGHEGGYVSHPSDPGGETNHGITVAVARAHGYTGPMRDLPLSIARAIARTAYWDKVRADELPAALRYVVFDGAYHSGPAQSVKWLQRALGVADDGVIGRHTLAAAGACDPVAMRARVVGQRLRFLTGLKAWPAFGKGWARRTADLLEMA